MQYQLLENAWGRHTHVVTQRNTYMSGYSSVVRFNSFLVVVFQVDSCEEDEPFRDALLGIFVIMGIKTVFKCILLKISILKLLDSKEIST